MRNSDTIRVEAQRTIASLRSMLAGDYMRTAIDDPIDAVFDVAMMERPSSARHLIELVANLVRSAFARLPFSARRCSRESARDEAVALISSCYRAQDGTGFEGALLDAVDTSFAGMEQLCRRVAALLKSQLRQRYVTWVFTRHLDPANWAVNREIAELLLERLQGKFSGEAPRLRPEQFVDCIPDLFFAVQTADQAADSLLLDRFMPGA